MKSSSEDAAATFLDPIFLFLYSGNPSPYRATTTAPPRPMLCCRANLAPGTCLPPASFLNCQHNSAHWARPVKGPELRKLSTRWRKNSRGVRRLERRSGWCWSCGIDDPLLFLSCHNRPKNKRAIRNYFQNVIKSKQFTSNNN
jgi:hypothetical protein